ncbi:MAG: hypothetical protein IJK89_12125 [Clostridia bacterium]|nr:hypothetical protein [Clostridia bacterium]
MLKDFTKEPFDILIQAGQSNAEGYGFGSAEKPWEPNERVWYLNENFTISQAVESVTGNDIRSNFSLAFARGYLENNLLAEGRSLLILRAAVGGTGFLDNNWKPNDVLYLRMLDMIKTALDLNGGNRLVALLWHQGEQDAVLNASYETHYNHLMTLVRGVRETFNVPGLPFVAGDFVQHWEQENMAICTPVVDAIRAVCRDCGRGAFVESDGLLSNAQFSKHHPFGWDDSVHFCRAAIYGLGERYFRAFTEITGTDA